MTHQLRGPSEERAQGSGQAGRVLGAAELAPSASKLGDADVDGGDAEPGRRDRPDGRAAGDVVAADEPLVGGTSACSQASTMAAAVAASVA